MYRHRRIVAQRVVAPDALVERLAAEHYVGVGHEEAEQFVLLVFQGHLFAAYKDAAGVGVQRDVTEAYLREAPGVGALQAVVLREVCLYARDEHVWGEGLGYVGRVSCLCPPAGPLP